MASRARSGDLHADAVVGDNLRIRIEDKVAAVELEDVGGADARATTAPA
jgi:hypothetical protein